MSATFDVTNVDFTFTFVTMIVVVVYVVVNVFRWIIFGTIT